MEGKEKEREADLRRRECGRLGWKWKNEVRRQALLFLEGSSKTHSFSCFFLFFFFWVKSTTVPEIWPHLSCSPSIFKISRLDPSLLTPFVYLTCHVIFTDVAHSYLSKKKNIETTLPISLHLFSSLLFSSLSLLSSFFISLSFKTEHQNQFPLSS